MPTILDHPPGYVTDHLATLKGALDRPADQGGVPPKDGDGLLLATWNLREFGRFTPKWRSGPGDSPTRDLRSLLFIAAILERFDVIALQELQGYTDALRAVLRWLNRDIPARWRIVVSDVVKGAAGDDERLGYLFDSSRYDLDGLVGELVIPPEEVGISAARLDRQFAKTPYAVSFRSVHDTDDAFVLITVHIVWGSDPALRAKEANRVAEWIRDEAAEPQVWDSDIFALGDFNADRITNPDGSINPIYKPFADTLTIPEEMNGFPRTIFGGGKDKHYDQITWYDKGPNRFSLRFDDCGYFDIDTVLRPGYQLPARSFSFRMSDHFPLWARFSWP
jgi:endonuclease/exonuclease/phosphatase family metal-dependent hydrolase